MTKLDIYPLRAKLFTHGGSQAVRLPKAFRFEGAEVTIRAEGDRVILEPVRSRPKPTPEDMAAFWARLDGLTEEPFPEREPQSPLRDVDLDG
ncbi:antitoxin [Caulobacter sp. LARHSG274]